MKETQFSQNNHFEVGYDNRPFTLRSNSQQKFFYRVGEITRPVQDWRTQCLIAAHEISRIGGREIKVCLSGGVDSEIVAESFRQSGIPFSCVILKFKNDLNLHDISWALIYCETHQIPYQFITLDIEEFFASGEAMEISTKAQSIYPFLSPQFKLVELVHAAGGFPIVGTGEFNIRKVKNDWFLFEAEPMAAWERYFFNKPIPAVLRFFRWSPELIRSYLADPTVQTIIQQSNLPHHYNINDHKLHVYQKHWSLATRPKYRGYEKVAHLHQTYYGKLRQLFPDSHHEIGLPLISLLR